MIMSLPSRLIDTTLERRIGYKDIIWDVDGTLSDPTHRRHYVQAKPKNWKAFFAEMSDDPVHEDMKFLINSMADLGHTNIICTARHEKYKKETEDWLFRKKIIYHAIYMRDNDDHRDDSVIKIDLVRQMMMEGYYPTMAFEDRDRVALALREIGLRVFQVEDGKF